MNKIGLIIKREYLTRVRKRSFLIMTFLGPILMSGLIEILQENCTANRAGEWLDFAANSIGVCLGNAVGLLMRKYFKH